MRKIGTALLVGMLCVMSATATLASGTATLGQWIDGAAGSIESWARDSGIIEVSGQAVHTVAADRAVISMGIELEAQTEKQAQDGVQEAADAALAAILELGVEEDQIATSQFFVARRTRSGGWVAPREEVYYVASLQLEVTVQDFTQINPILNAALEQGVNKVQGIRYTLTDEGAAYRAALADATRIAKVKAEVMAEAAGVSLVSLLELRENTSGPAARYANIAMEQEAAPEAGPGALSMPGDLEIRAQVQLIYQVK